MAKVPTDFTKYAPKAQPVPSAGYSRAKIIGRNRQTQNAALAGIRANAQGQMSRLQGGIRATQQGIRNNEAGGQAAARGTQAAIESSNQAIRNARQINAGVQQMVDAGFEAQQKYIEAEFKSDEIRFENFMLKERALMERSLADAAANFKKTDEYEDQVQRIEQESKARVSQYVANNVNGRFADQFNAAGGNELESIAFKAGLKAPELNRQKAEVDMLEAFEDRLAAGDWQEAIGKLRAQAPEIIRDDARFMQVMSRAESQVSKRAIERVTNEAQDMIQNPNIPYNEAYDAARARVDETFEALRGTFPDEEAFAPEAADRLFRSIEGNGAYNLVTGFQSSLNSGAPYALQTLDTILDSDNPYKTLKETLDFRGDMTRAQAIQAVETLRGTRRKIREAQRENALGVIEGIQDGSIQIPEAVQLSQLDSTNGFGGLGQPFIDFFLSELPNVRDASLEDLEAEQFVQLEEYKELEADLIELSVTDDNGKYLMDAADTVEEDFLAVMQGAPASVKQEATMLYLGSMSRNLDRAIMVSAGFGKNRPIPDNVRGLMEEYIQNAKLTIRQYGASTNALSKIREDLQMIARSSIAPDGESIITPSGDTRRIEDDVFKIRQQDAAAAANAFSEYLMTMWVKGQMSARNTSEILKLMELRKEAAMQQRNQDRMDELENIAELLEERNTEDNSTPYLDGSRTEAPSWLREGSDERGGGVPGAKYFNPTEETPDWLKGADQ